MLLIYEEWLLILSVDNVEMSFYMNAIHGVAGKMALQFILRGHEGGGEL